MGNQVINIGAAPLVLNGQPLGGNFSFAYDLGGSTADYAGQAYNFLASQNQQDQAFLSGSIAGTQDFLAHQASPLIDTLNTTLSGVNNIMTANRSAALSLNPIVPPTFSVQGMIDAYGNQMASQQTTLADLTSQSIAQIGQNTASTNAASTNVASSSSGSFCFITTAICESENLPDDCEELMTMRKFRDEVLAQTEQGKAMIKKYYEMAPAIVEKINACPDAKHIYFVLRWDYIHDILMFIKMKMYNCATTKYIQMVRYCERIR